MKRSRSLGFWVVSSSMSAFTAGFLGLILPLAFFNGAVTAFHPTYATCSLACPLILIIDPSPQVATLGYFSVASIAAGFLVLSPLFRPKRNLVFGLVTLLGSMFILMTAVTVDILLLDVIPTFYLSFPLAGSLLMLGATLLLFRAPSMRKEPI